MVVRAVRDLVGVDGLGFCGFWVVMLLALVLGVVVVLWVWLVAVCR